MRHGRGGSDVNLVEVGNFAKYENGVIRGREDFGRNMRYGRESAGEFQTTATKSAKHILTRSTGGKRSGKRKRKGFQMC